MREKSSSAEHIMQVQPSTGLQGCVRGVPVLLQPHQREPWPWLGGCSPSPALGHQQEHICIHPAPGEDGLGHHLSPRSCTQLLFPSTTSGKLCLFGCSTQGPLTPGQGGAQEKCSSWNSSQEKWPVQGRAATESGTVTQDLLPAGNVVRAWTEFNQSRG